MTVAIQSDDTEATLWCDCTGCNACEPSDDRPCSRTLTRPVNELADVAHELKWDINAIPFHHCPECAYLLPDR